MEHDKIIRVIRGLIAELGLSLEDVQVSEAAGQTIFAVTSKDSALLIGTRGETLQALNHLVKKFIESSVSSDEPLRFLVDVNGYHLKHIKTLETEARVLAERARTFKYDVEMSPMSPYDRLIVHASLAGLPGIKTESQGEGPTRHLIIRYVGDPATTSAL